MWEFLPGMVFLNVQLLFLQVQAKIIAPEKQAMFELASERPGHWYNYHEAAGGATYQEYAILDTDRVFDTDDEFELLW